MFVSKSFRPLYVFSITFFGRSDVNSSMSSYNALESGGRIQTTDSNCSDLSLDMSRKKLHSVQAEAIRVTPDWATDVWEERDKSMDTLSTSPKDKNDLISAGEPERRKKNKPSNYFWPARKEPKPDTNTRQWYVRVWFLLCWFSAPVVIQLLTEWLDWNHQVLPVLKNEKLMEQSTDCRSKGVLHTCHC